MYNMYNVTNYTNYTNTANNTHVPYSNKSLILSLIIIASFIFSVSSCFICSFYRYHIYNILYDHLLTYLHIPFVTFASPYDLNQNIQRIQVKEKIPPLKPPDGVLVINPAGEEDYAFGANNS